MQHFINVQDSISELIKITQSEDHISNHDELIKIINFIKNISINRENIHSTLKLIANLSKYKSIQDTDEFYFDIDSLITYAMVPNIKKTKSDPTKIKAEHKLSCSDLSTSDLTCSDDSIVSEEFVGSDDSVSSDSYDNSESYFEIYVSDETTKSDLKHITDLNHVSDLKHISDLKLSTDTKFETDLTISDGDVISLVNIYCSNRFANIDKAINLIEKYHIHKSSSYLPVIKYLIDTNDYPKLRQFYSKLIKRNQNTKEQNRKIKEFNHKARSYNEKIKLLKRKYEEMSLINSELQSIDLEANAHPNLNRLMGMFDESNFKEIVPKNERNIIEIPNTIVKDIMMMAISSDDNDFINEIVQNITNPTNELISALKVYFTKLDVEFMYANVNNGHCTCCNKTIPNNVICSDDRQNILKRISTKVLSTTHRHDNGSLISHSERQSIVDKWHEFERLVKANKFDIVIDGANLGYIATKGSNDINIKYIQTTIQNIISSTNKKVLLIMHQRHIGKIRMLNFGHLAANVKIYTTPNNVNDDWFWLYASIFCKCYILTNDQSRDHGCMVSYQNEIKKWLQHYQLKLKPDGTINIKDLTEKESVYSPGIFYSDELIHIIPMAKHNKIICIHL